VFDSFCLSAPIVFLNDSTVNKTLGQYNEPPTVIAMRVSNEALKNFLRSGQAVKV
jgi:hypothetical protein